MRRRLLSAVGLWSIRVLPEKLIWWGCAAHFPKPLPYSRPKSGIFPILFITVSLIIAWFQTCLIISSPVQTNAHTLLLGSIASSEKRTQFNNLVLRAFSLTWGRGGAGNEVQSTKTTSCLRAEWPKSIPYL